MMVEAIVEQKPFSWGVWIGGLMLALVIGGPANVVAGLAAMSQHNAVSGFLIGVIPGVFLMLVYLGIRRNVRALALGILTGACAIALIGGICGGSLAGTSFR
jgi:hypothetical protein